LHFSGITGVSAISWDVAWPNQAFTRQRDQYLLYLYCIGINAKSRMAASLYPEKRYQPRASALPLSYFAGYRRLLPPVICGAIAALIARASAGSTMAQLEFGLVLGIVVATPGAFVIYALAPGIGPSTKRAVIYGGAALEALRIFVMIVLHQPNNVIAVTSGAGFGTVALCVMGWRCIVARTSAQRKSELDIFSAALVLPFGTIIVGAIIEFESKTARGMFDYRL
jgi:hypothetical protein